MFAESKQKYYVLYIKIHILFSCVVSFFPPPQNAGWWRDPKASGVRQRVPFRSCAASLLLSPVSPFLSPRLRSGFQIPQRTDLTLAWKPSSKERHRRWTAAGFLLEDAKLPLTFDPNLKGRLDKHEIWINIKWLLVFTTTNILVMQHIILGHKNETMQQTNLMRWSCL